MKNYSLKWWYQNKTGSENISIGENTKIAPSACLDGISGRICIGSSCLIHPGVMLLPFGGRITMFFSARENATLRAIPDSRKLEAFFNCWTRKEAYIWIPCRWQTLLVC